MNSIRILTAVALAAVALIVAPAMTASAAPPAMSVRPSAHLVGGDTVRVHASGITPRADVRVVQCDEYAGNPDDDCYGGTDTRADATGHVSVAVTLADPVHRAHEFGDPTPVYCRAQVCRLFLAWTDADGNQQVLASQLLAFRGAPAVIVVTPNSGLRRVQRVAVTGSAHGAQGHRVRVVEEACIAIIQGHSCTEQYPAVSATVGADGKYATSYRVRRYLPDGRDCASDDDMGLEYCQLTTVVLDAQGRPDMSFGDPSWGDPHGWLAFRGA